MIVVGALIFATLNFTGTAYAKESDLTSEQVAVNKQVYNIAAEFFNNQHILQSYSSSKPIFKSFFGAIDPMFPLAISCVEWGGNARMDYILSSPIATKEIAALGYSLEDIDFSSIGNDFYVANGISTRMRDGKYKGPLQIDYNSFYTEEIKFTNEFRPVDPYNFRDSCDWYIHNYGRQFVSAWNKNHVFQNKYEALVHAAIMTNTGWSYISTSATFGSSSTATTFPWKDANAIFRFASDVSSNTRLKTIFAHADSNLKKKLDLMRAGKTGNDLGNIQLNLNICYQDIFAKLGLDIADYIKPQYVAAFNGKSSNYSTTTVREKVLYPIQVIWAYHHLEYFYEGGIL